MRDGQQNQSIRYEVKLLLKQTAYYESEELVILVLVNEQLIIVIYYWACVTHEMKIIPQELAVLFSILKHTWHTYVQVHETNCHAQKRESGVRWILKDNLH